MTLLLRTKGGCEFDPEHLLDMFSGQRQRFVTILRGFGPDEWAAPTRCTAWSRRTWSATCATTI
jgi:hypothetical protein